MTPRHKTVRKKHIPKESHLAALLKFKADPTGPMAGEHLRSAFLGIEQMGDLMAQFRAAAALTTDLMRLLDRTEDEAMRKRITQIIGREVQALARQSVQRMVIEKAVKEGTVGIDASMNEPHYCEEKGSGDTQSFQIMLENIISAHPRFKHLVEEAGEMRVRCGDSIKVTKKRALPPSVNPYQGKAKYAIIGLSGVVLVTAMGFALMRGEEPEAKPSPPAPPQEKVEAEKKDDGLNAYQRRVTANEDPIDTAARAAIWKAHRGKLSISQAFDIYDWFIRNISYMQDAHPTVPRWPRQVLATGSGDCKSMAVALASMLENIGFRTVLLEYLELSKEDPGRLDGHMYLGVLASTKQDDIERRREVKKVRRLIIRRYMKKLIRIDPRSYPYERKFPKIHFRQLLVNGQKHAYLLLDPTFGPHSVPGIAKPKEPKEQFFIARPDPALVFLAPILR